MPKPLEPTFRTFAGIKNTVEPERLGPQDLADGVNVDLDNAGLLRRRGGQTGTSIDDAVHSIWSPEDESLCLFVQDGELRRLELDYSSSVLATGLSEDPMAYVPMNRRVYFSNGRIRGVLDNGMVRGWGMRIPELPAAVAALGEMTAGTYLITRTTVAIDGRESGAPLAERIDLGDNSGITFTWEPQADRVALYLTHPNGREFYRAALVDGVLGTYTWRGGTLGTMLETQFLDPPPVGHALTDWRTRILVASGPNIFATKSLAPELCDLKDFKGVDGTNVRFVVGLEGGFFAGTEKEVAFMQGVRISELSKRVVVEAAGVAGSAVRVDSAKIGLAAGTRVALFTTRLGVYAGFPDGTVRNLTRDRYIFDAPERAAAIVRTRNKISQYLVTA